MGGADPQRADPFLICRDRPEWHSDWRRDQGRRRGLSWRWLSYADVELRMRQWRRQFESLPTGARVGFFESPSVEALAIDLAARAAGLWSVPLMTGTGQDGDHGPEIAEDVSALTSIVLEAGSEPPAASVASDYETLRVDAEGPRPVGGCSIVEAGGLRLDVDAERLEAAADLLAAVLGEFRRRPVVVHGRSLADVSERVVVEWAIRAGGAIVLPTPAGSMRSSIGEAAFQHRPTLLHGRAGDLEAWARLFREGESRPAGLRARFRNLRWILVAGSEPLKGRTSSFFLDLGAAVVGLEETGALAFDRL